MTGPEIPSVTAPPVRDEQPVRLLRRSKRDRVIGGVCGGLGRYLGVDPVLLRIVAVALTLSGGAGVLAYLVAWVVIPEADQPEPPPNQDGRHGAALIAGAVLVAVGGLLLLRAAIPWFDAGLFWPLVVVAVGALLVASAKR